MSDNTNNGPLDGITVLDLSVAMAGPYSATILADLGARVIKVEMPGKGDLTRQLSPRLGGHSATFLALNRGKESMTLDLRGRAARRSSNAWLKTYMSSSPTPGRASWRSGISASTGCLRSTTHRSTAPCPLMGTHGASKSRPGSTRRARVMPD